MGRMEAVITLQRRGIGHGQDGGGYNTTKKGYRAWAGWRQL